MLDLCLRILALLLLGLAEAFLLWTLWHLMLATWPRRRSSANPHRRPIAEPHRERALPLE